MLLKHDPTTLPAIIVTSAPVATLRGWGEGGRR